MTRTETETRAQVLDVLATPRPAKPASPAMIAHRLDRLADAVNRAAAMLDGGPCLTPADVERVETMRGALDRLARAHRAADVDAAAADLAALVTA